MPADELCTISMEAVMRKVVALLAVSTLVAACKPFGGPTGNPIADAYPIFRCAAYLDTPSLNQWQLAEIRSLSRRDNGCKLILGRMYEEGRGVPQDIPQAKTIYESLAKEDPRAYNRLGAIAEKGLGGPVDLVAARDFYQRAVSRPDNTYIEAKLARFMEDGTGGPQDLPGAMKYYLSSAEEVGSDSWQGVERLRAKGVPMTTGQQQRYNDVFIRTVKHQVQRKIEIIGKSLAAEKLSTPDNKAVHVQLEGSPGSVVPAISLQQSSGNDVIDQKVLQGFSDYRFPGEPIMPEGQKTYKIIPVVVTDGKTRMERFWDSRKTETQAK